MLCDERNTYILYILYYIYIFSVALSESLFPISGQATVRPFDMSRAWQKPHQHRHHPHQLLESSRQVALLKVAKTHAAKRQIELPEILAKAVAAKRLRLSALQKNKHHSFISIHFIHQQTKVNPLLKQPELPTSTHLQGWPFKATFFQYVAWNSHSPLSIAPSFGR